LISPEREKVRGRPCYCHRKGRRPLIRRVSTSRFFDRTLTPIEARRKCSPLSERSSPTLGPTSTTSSPKIDAETRPTSFYEIQSAVSDSRLDPTF
ncbi:unnamed protein product, partial [Tenebrio molitor]